MGYDFFTCFLFFFGINVKQKRGFLKTNLKEQSLPSVWTLCDTQNSQRLVGNCTSLSEGAQDQGNPAPLLVQDQHLRGDTGFMADLHWDPECHAPEITSDLRNKYCEMMRFLLFLGWFSHIVLWKIKVLKLDNLHSFIVKSIFLEMCLLWQLNET